MYITTSLSLSPFVQYNSYSSLPSHRTLILFNSFLALYQLLERCAAASLQWADNNTVHFETSKTGAILFSGGVGRHRCDRTIRVEGQLVKLTPAAITWLEIWLDSTLSLAENRKRRIAKTRQAEARRRRIVNKYGAPPAAARNLLISIVQGTMLHAAEPTWKGQGSVEDEYQQAINRMGRSALGAWSSTPRGILVGESGLTLARALLNYRQASFT